MIYKQKYTKLRILLDFVFLFSYNKSEREIPFALLLFFCLLGEIMKHLVQTNLENVGTLDFRTLYTDEVKNAQLDYAHGKKGSTPETEQKYVFDKFMAAKAELPEEVTVLPKYDIDKYLEKGYNKIFVCLKYGSDENTGKENSPVATIEKAISLIKEGEATAIVIHAGEYCIADTLQLDKKLSGSVDFPLIFTSAGDGEVVISAAKSIEFSDFSPIEADDEIAARLPEHAKSKVLFVDCRKKGWSKDQIGDVTIYHVQEDIGIVRKHRSPTLYADGEAQILARYPNKTNNHYDLLYFENVFDTGSVIDRDGSCLYMYWVARVEAYVEYKEYLAGKRKKPDWQNYTYVKNGHEYPLYKSEEHALADYEKLAARENEGFAPFVDKYGRYNMDMGFTVGLIPNRKPQADVKSTQEEIDEVAKWKSVYDRDVMIYGNAYAGWDYDRYKVKSVIKGEDGMCRLTTKGGSRWGAMNSANSPTGHNTYHFYNAIEALDTAGEWYMDVPTGRLYIYPTKNMKNAKIQYSANVCDLMRITADNVIVNGIHFDKGVSRGIVAEDCEGVVVQNCKGTNMSDIAVLLDNTIRCAVIHNEFRYNKTVSAATHGQKSIENGVRQLNIIQNNMIDEPIDNQCGLSISGFMNCASHNTLRLTNISVGGGGRPSIENIIEYNDIPGGNTTTSDAGLVYMNQFFARGTHIRYNYMHDWHAPGNGVYFDDLNSGNYAYYNIIDTTCAKSKKPTAFIYSSSGHDHVMFNNFCVGRTRIYEDGQDANGKHFERFFTGTIASSIEAQTEDGKYPFVVTTGGKTYTVNTEMTDRITNFLFVGSEDIGEGVKLEVWSIKTRSDDEGDYVSLTWRYPDGAWRRWINFNDRINQSWMYFSDTCHLGYRFPGFADKFISVYSAFAKEGSIYEKRFPELFTYMDMYKEYIENRYKDGYRINPLEIFIRSTAMNNIQNNIVAGCARAFNAGEADSGVKGVDAYGNDYMHVSVDTAVYRGNLDNTSEGYVNVVCAVEEYQDKNKPCPFSFAEFMETLEEEQKKANPEYKSLVYLLSCVGIKE